MVVYHGTTMDVAEKIKREGLRPNPDSAFLTTRTDDFRTLGKHDAVYVTTNKLVAKMFALFRAEYERVPEGTAIPWGELSLIKHGREIKKNAKPAIVKLDLPSNVIPRLEIDEQAGPLHAFKYPGILSPELVKAIEPIKGTWENDTISELNGGDFEETGRLYVQNID
jgi:hypothetical protein